MAMNVGRWLRYAQAKVGDVVRSAEADLARREAAREVEQADKPWLNDDAEAPDLDTARARIAWEAEQAEAARREQTEQADPTAAERADRTDDPSAPPAGTADPDEGTDPGEGTGAEPSGGVVDLGRYGTDEAEAAQARIELDQRAADSAARLEAIRRELGVDDPDGSDD